MYNNVTLYLLLGISQLLHLLAPQIYTLLQKRFFFPPELDVTTSQSTLSQALE